MLLPVHIAAPSYGCVLPWKEHMTFRIGCIALDCTIIGSISQRRSSFQDPGEQKQVE